MRKEILLILFASLCINLYPQEYNVSYVVRPLKKEIYTTYQEFRTGQNSFTDPFYLDSLERHFRSWEGTYSVLPKYSGNDKDIKGIWGFCDGENYYIHHYYGSEFFKIDTGKELLTFDGYDSPTNYGSVAHGSNMAGIIGGAIAPAIAKNYKHTYFIGPFTGLIYEDEDKFYKDESQFKYTKLIFYRMAKEEAPGSIHFKVADSMSFSFLPNSYYEINLPMSFKPIRLSYGEEYSQYTNIYLTPKELKYIRVTHTLNDGETRFIHVSETEGEFDSYTPRKKQKKRDKNM